MKNTQIPTLPVSVECYKKAPIWLGSQIPASMLAKHNTKAQVWAVINILQGSLELKYTDTGDSITLTPEKRGICAPQQWHFITIPTNVNEDDVKIQINFYK